MGIWKHLYNALTRKMDTIAGELADPEALLDAEIAALTERLQDARHKLRQLESRHGQMAQAVIDLEKQIRHWEERIRQHHQDAPTEVARWVERLLDLEAQCGRTKAHKKELARLIGDGRERIRSWSQAIAEIRDRKTSLAMRQHMAEVASAFGTSALQSFDVTARLDAWEQRLTAAEEKATAPALLDQELANEGRALCVQSRLARILNEGGVK